MSTLTELRADYRAAVAAHDAAQVAESKARGEMFIAAQELRVALDAHVRARFRPNEIIQTKAGELLITSISVAVSLQTEVRAVYHQRTKAGTWGKTRTTSAAVFWDFERDCWHYEALVTT